MFDYRFMYPDWIHALWLVVGLVGLLFWLDRRSGAALDRFVSRTMQSRLVQRTSNLRRWLSIACIGLALGCLVFAVMRPQWGVTYLKAPRIGAQIMVCLDVSKSMLAEDTAPNRLDRAKSEVVDLLDYLRGDQVGLIAFAGTANVLCPLTPDFGFFKLILNHAGPHSVGRGGTQLEAPLRKAIAGFRGESNISRVILLITDGEDHDSFPVDAAKAAAERGIKILTIGFGDEAGSPIEITNPETGSKTLIRDRDGNTVRSKLNGELLREIALVTEGAYVPAGTGSLDLESIYQVHIAPLMRGQLEDRGIAVRHEGFQWLLLAALVFLMTSVILRSGSSLRSGVLPITPPGSASVSKAAAVAFSFFLTAQSVLLAQSEPPKQGTKAPTQSSEPKLSDDPRDNYNNALLAMASNLDQAEKLLMAARRSAGTDGEVRFRASYNMGWVEVKRADQLLEESPEQALEHLRSAADWFRDAIRLRPDQRDARHNLEVVLRRALELADSLAKKQPQDLATRLDELIRQQRDVLADAAALVERVSTEEEVHASDGFRSEFRALSVAQRQILSDAEALNESVHEEHDALKAKPEEELQPQDRMRQAQLSGVLHYLQQSVQRLGQARSQMRRRQGMRAYRRSAAALEELKRARDQLRDPVEVLSVLVADATSLAKQTSAMSSAQAQVNQDNAPDVPAWLTSEYLEESQQSTKERTQELVAKLEAGLAAQNDPDTQPQQPPDPQTERLLAKLEEAVPLIQQGAQSFEEAQSQLAEEEYRPALEKQVAGIVALEQAQELFLDLRRLIELIYADERRIASMIFPNEQTLVDPDGYAARLAEFVPVADRLQQRNFKRMTRLHDELDFALTQLEESSAQPNPMGGNPQGQDPQAEKQRLEQAKQLAQLADEQLQLAASMINTMTTETAPYAEESIEPARMSVQQSLTHLQALRRLFFSIVEHLRETAQRQSQLNDETEQTKALIEPDKLQQSAGPLGLRQFELSEISKQIAQALQEQSQQQPQTPTQDPQQLKQIQEATQKLAQAAELVHQGQQQMQDASAKFQEEPLELDAIRESQDVALEKLLEALALLNPPQQNQQNQNQNQQNQDQQQDQSEQDQEEQNQQGADPTRLLQAVRDREAQRRREKESRRFPAQSVDKDW